MSPAAMSDRLSGKTPIDVNELEAIAAQLAVSPEHLLREVDAS
jgi:hypothetical protein